MKTFFSIQYCYIFAQTALTLRDLVYICSQIIRIQMERKRINRLKVVLAEKGMTNKQLSEILDKDPAVISKWVTNAAQPNVEMFIQLAKVLGVSVDDLLWISSENG